MLDTKKTMGGSHESKSVNDHCSCRADIGGYIVLLRLPLNLTEQQQGILTA